MYPRIRSNTKRGLRFEGDEYDLNMLWIKFFYVDEPSKENGKWIFKHLTDTQRINDIPDLEA
jgi:hypothetical protein